MFGMMLMMDRKKCSGSVKDEPKCGEGEFEFAPHRAMVSDTLECPIYKGKANRDPAPCNVALLEKTPRDK